MKTNSKCDDAKSSVNFYKLLGGFINRHVMTLSFLQVDTGTINVLSTIKRKN